MKLLVLLLFVGVVTSAPYHDAVDDAADEVLMEFLADFEQDALELMYRAEETDEEPKTELGKKLRVHLDDILEKIKDAIEHGKKVKEEWLDKAKEIREDLKKLKEDVGKKARDLYEKVKEKLKEKGKEVWDRILEKLGLKDKDEGSSDDLAHSIFETIFDKMRKLREKIENSKTIDDLKKAVEDIFGKTSELAKSLLGFVKGSLEEARELLLKFIRRFLPDRDVEKRSLKDAWEKVKDFFHKAKIDLKDKYAKFGEWVKEKLEQKKEVLKEKIESLKKIAKEVGDDVKSLTKDILLEAREFFDEHKKEIGDLWEHVREKINTELRKKE